MLMMSVNYFGWEYDVIVNFLEARARKIGEASSVFLKNSLKPKKFSEMWSGVKFLKMIFLRV